MPTTAVDTYALTPEQVDFRDTIRQIVRERVAPRAAEIDAKAEYPWDIRKLFAEQDLLGLPFDEEFGGTGTGTLMLQMAVEEVATACASSALIALTAHAKLALLLRCDSAWDDARRSANYSASRRDSFHFVSFRAAARSCTTAQARVFRVFSGAR